MSGRTRREFLRRGLIGAGIVAGGRLATGCNDGSGGGSDAGSHPTDLDAAGADSPLADVGPLQDPDENGLRLPEGFTSRVVARSGNAPVKGGSCVWHPAPDGGATFATDDGGWIYVSNSEATPGGVGALPFDAEGALVDAYAIGSAAMVRNCAGGPTPWGTPGGRVLPLVQVQGQDESEIPGPPSTPAGPACTSASSVARAPEARRSGRTASPTR